MLLIPVATSCMIYSEVSALSALVAPKRSLACGLSAPPRPVVTSGTPRYSICRDQSSCSQILSVTGDFPLS